MNPKDEIKTRMEAAFALEFLCPDHDRQRVENIIETEVDNLVFDHPEHSHEEISGYAYEILPDILETCDVCLYEGAQTDRFEMERER